MSGIIKVEDVRGVGDVSHILLEASRGIEKVEPVWEGLELTDDRDYILAGTILRGLVTEQRRVHDVLDPFVNFFSKAHRDAVALRKNYLDRIEEGVGSTKSLITDYRELTPSIPAKMDGVSFSSTWKAEVEPSRQEDFLRAVSEDFEKFGHLVKVDSRALSKMASGLQRGLEDLLPGVKVTETRVISVRTK